MQDVEGKTEAKLVAKGPGGFFTPLGWSPDDRFVLVGRTESNMNQDIYVVEVAKGTLKLLTPHQVYEFEVDLWATANTFKAGNRIRVAVTSSSFPRFDRNLNTGGPLGQEVVGQAAINTIFHDAMRPSRIVLPVID